MECTCSEGSSMWPMFIMMSVTILAGLGTVGFAMRGRGALPGSSVTKTVETTTRDVQTQSQVTYARERREPRFVPLADRENGAWPW